MSANRRIDIHRKAKEFAFVNQQSAARTCFVYIAVDDRASYRQRITEAGGKIVVEEMEVPGMGSFSLFADPDGRVMGIWKTN